MVALGNACAGEDPLRHLVLRHHGAEAKADGEECVDARWLRPQDALDAYQRDELLLVFPTIRHLQELSTPESVEHALSVARERRIQPIEPRVVLDQGGVARILLPGEDGYDSAGQAAG